MEVSRRAALQVLGALAACDGSGPKPTPTVPKPPQVTRQRPRVVHYGLDLSFDFAARSFKGNLELTLKLGDAAEPLVLASKDLSILSVKDEGGRDVPFTSSNNSLQVTFARSWDPESEQRVRLEYAGRASKGLRMFEDQIYTAYDTASWMPCDFDPGSRATFTLEVASKPGWLGIGNGTPTTGNDPQRQSWALTTPYPAYTLGFAIGELWEATSNVDGTDLVLLASVRTPREARALGEEIARMFTFFQDRSGVRYAQAGVGKRFTTVLARGDVAQEYAGFAVVSDQYALEWMAEPREDWVFCHELAHSWWGNLVTCASWSQFWLNEAFAVFMTALYKEQRWGQREYDRERGVARRRVQRMLRAEKGRPLELPAGTLESEAGGGWPYGRGFEVLHEARRTLGDPLFLRALRDYTTGHTKRSVTTNDWLDAFSAGDAKLRDELATLVKTVPSKAAPASLNEWIQRTASATNDIDRFMAIDAIGEACASSADVQCPAALASLAIHTNDPSRLVATAARRVRRAGRLTYWKTRRRGANLFNKLETAERLMAARDAGIEFVRLAPNKWSTTSRDFLLGSADNHTEVVMQDARTLLAVLDAAERAQLKVLLTTLSLPGARWRQQHGNRNDLRLWTTDSVQGQAAKFWNDLVEIVGGHDALIGYDILNEPRPEALERITDTNDMKYRAWSQAAVDKVEDVNRFYRRVVAAIRAADPVTPIVLESSMDAAADAFEFLQPFDDPSILYSFHFYGPWLYTGPKNANGKYKYPGPVPADESDPRTVELWDEARVRKALQGVFDWMKKHAIAPERVIAAEIGCQRRAPGVVQYMEDVVRILEQAQIHWAFYSFREDEWDAMDYELGTSSTNTVRGDNPLWEVLASRLKSRR